MEHISKEKSSIKDNRLIYKNSIAYDKFNYYYNKNISEIDEDEYCDDDDDDDECEDDNEFNNNNIKEDEFYDDDEYCDDDDDDSECEDEETIYGSGNQLKNKIFIFMNMKN